MPACAWGDSRTWQGRASVRSQDALAYREKYGGLLDSNLDPCAVPERSPDKSLALFGAVWKKKTNGCGKARGQWNPERVNYVFAVRHASGPPRPTYGLPGLPNPLRCSRWISAFAKARFGGTCSRLLFTDSYGGKSESVRGTIYLSGCCDYTICPSHRLRSFGLVNASASCAENLTECRGIYPTINTQSLDGLRKRSNDTRPAGGSSAPGYASFPGEDPY